MRETHTPITVFTLQLPEIYSKEGGKIQLKKVVQVVHKLTTWTSCAQSCANSCVTRIFFYLTVNSLLGSVWLEEWKSERMEN